MTTTESDPTTTAAIGYRRNLPVDDPASLLEESVPVPDLRPHDLLVEVAAVSVNPVDVKLRAGAAADDLRVLGFDAAGTVRAVGADVTLFGPGDEVYYAGAIDRPGSNQRLQAVDERIVGRRPASISMAESASLPLVAITAWETLFDRFALTAESEGVLLVVGATGGVGSVLLQLPEAILPRVTVIATASSPERAEWVHSLGAEHVVDHRADLIEQVRTIAPQGVRWLFTAHSENQLEAYAEIDAPFGAITAIDDGPRDVAPLKSKVISWHWEFMFARPLYGADDLVEQHRLLDRVADLVDAGSLRPVIDRVLTPITAETLREAHGLVESNHVLGKVVLHGWV